MRMRHVRRILDMEPPPVWVRVVFVLVLVMGWIGEWRGWWR